jgi:hypothetical protein
VLLSGSKLVWEPIWDMEKGRNIPAPWAFGEE